MQIPVETRKKMLAAVERGEPIVAVARRFEVSERGLHKLIKRCRERGASEPLKPGPKKPIKLKPIDDEVMLSMIAQDPGVTLREIAERLGGKVVESTLSRRLRKLGMSFKKNH